MLLLLMSDQYQVKGLLLLLPALIYVCQSREGCQRERERTGQTLSLLMSAHSSDDADDEPGNKVQRASNVVSQSVNQSIRQCV